MAAETFMTCKCAVMGCMITETKQCSACSSAFYCSPEHQRLDWKLHKHVCKTIVSVKTTTAKTTKTAKKNNPESVAGVMDVKVEVPVLTRRAMSINAPGVGCIAKNFYIDEKKPLPYCLDCQWIQTGCHFTYFEVVQVNLFCSHDSISETERYGSSDMTPCDVHAKQPLDQALTKTRAKQVMSENKTLNQAHAIKHVLLQASSLPCLVLTRTPVFLSETTTTDGSSDDFRLMVDGEVTSFVVRDAKECLHFLSYEAKLSGRRCKKQLFFSRHSGSEKGITIEFDYADYDIMNGVDAVVHSSSRNSHEAVSVRYHYPQCDEALIKMLIHAGYQSFDNMMVQKVNASSSSSPSPSKRTKGCSKKKHSNPKIRAKTNTVVAVVEEAKKTVDGGKEELSDEQKKAFIIENIHAIHKQLIERATIVDAMDSEKWTRLYYTDSKRKVPLPLCTDCQLVQTGLTWAHEDVAASRHQYDELVKCKRHQLKPLDIKQVQHLVDQSIRDQDIQYVGSGSTAISVMDRVQTTKLVLSTMEQPSTSAVALLTRTPVFANAADMAVGVLPRDGRPTVYLVNNCDECFHIVMHESDISGRTCMSKKYRVHPENDNVLIRFDYAEETSVIGVPMANVVGYTYPKCHDSERLTRLLFESNFICCS